jgi:hypothetical protein
LGRFEGAAAGVKRTTNRLYRNGSIVKHDHEREIVFPSACLSQLGLGATIGTRNTAKKESSLQRATPMNRDNP